MTVSSITTADLLFCAGIIIARIMDVSIGTMRTISVVQGRAILSWFLGFFEVLIWVLAVSQVLQNLGTPIYLLSYALGYASGNFVGVKMEGRLAFGHQVVRVFTRAGSHVAAALRDHGYRVTTFEGHGREGAVSLLFIETARRETARILKRVAEIDPNCFYLVDDIRLAAQPAMIHHTPTGWRAILKRK